MTKCYVFVRVIIHSPVLWPYANIQQQCAYDPQPIALNPSANGRLQCFSGSLFDMPNSSASTSPQIALWGMLGAYVAKKLFSQSDESVSDLQVDRPN